MLLYACNSMNGSNCSVICGNLGEWLSRFVIVEVYDEAVDLGVNIVTLSYDESRSSFMELYVQYV